MQRVVFPLQPRNARQEGLRLMGFGALMAVAGAFALVNSGDGTISAPRLIGFLVGFSGVFNLGLGLVQVVRGRDEGDVEIDGDTLRAFPRERAKRRVSVPIAELRSLIVRANARGARAYIGTRTGLLVLNAADFVDPEDLGRLALALRERVGQLPNGAQRLDWFREQMDQARVVTQRRPWVTYGFLAIIAVMFGLQVQLNAIQDPVQMIRLGAGAPALIAEGEWYRLVSANFMHGIDVHIFANGLALWIIGGLLERLAGSWAFAIIAMLSALGGALTSTLLSDAPIMVGASTTLYGLFGALLVMDRVYRWQIPPIFRESIRMLIILLVINVVITLPVPQIDKAAHLGGFVAGAAATYWMIRDGRYQPQRSASKAVRAMAIGLGLLFAAGLGRAAQNAWEFKPAPILRVLLSHPDIQPVTLNNAAWTTLVRPDVDAETLGLCLEMAEKAIASAQALRPPADASAETQQYYGAVLATYLDTRAGARYRLGNVAEALVDEARALVLDRLKSSIFVAHTVKIATDLSPLNPMIRVDETLAVKDAQADQTVLATVKYGRLTGIVLGRPDAQGQMKSEKSGLPPDAEITLRWVGALPESANVVPVGGWVFLEQVRPGELP